MRKWYQRDYQAAVLRRARLLDAARKAAWKRLPEMLAEIAEADDDAGLQGFAGAAAARLPDDQRSGPRCSAALGDPSPLVRSSAASALGATT